RSHGHFSSNEKRELLTMNRDAKACLVPGTRPLRLITRRLVSRRQCRSCRRQDLIAALAGLPRELRDVVVLTGLGDFSEAEGCQVLEVAPEVVARRVSEARTLLRSELVGLGAGRAQPERQRSHPRARSRISRYRRRRRSASRRARPSPGEPPL